MKETCDKYIENVIQNPVDLYVIKKKPTYRPIKKLKSLRYLKRQEKRIKRLGERSKNQKSSILALTINIISKIGEKKNTQNCSQ